MIDAYQVGIKIKVDDNASTVINAMIGHLNNLQTTLNAVNVALKGVPGLANQATNALHGMGTAANNAKSSIGGMNSGMGGFVRSTAQALLGMHAISMALHGIREAAKLSMEVTDPIRTQAALESRERFVGTPEADIVSMRQRSVELQRQNPDLTSNDIQGLSDASNSVMRNAAESNELAPVAADFMSAAKAMAMPDPEAQWRDNLKMMEGRGVLRTHTGEDGQQHYDMQRIQDLTHRSLLNFGMTHGTITPHSTLQASQQMGGAATTMADDVFMAKNAELYFQMGASKAATATAGLNRQFQKGSYDIATARALVEAGVLDQSMVHHVRGARGLRADPGAMINQGAFDTDQVGYAAEHARVYMEKENKKIDDWNKAHPGGRQRDHMGFQMAAYRLYGKENSVRLLNDDNNNQQLLENYRKQQNTTMAQHDLHGAVAQMRTDNPNMGISSFKSAFEEMEKEFSKEALGPMMDGIGMVTQTMHQITEWMKSHPDDMKKMADGLREISMAIGKVVSDSLVSTLKFLTSESGLPAFASALKTIADTLSLLPGFILHPLSSAGDAVGSVGFELGMAIDKTRNFFNPSPSANEEADRDRVQAERSRRLNAQHGGPPTPPPTAGAGADLNAMLNQMNTGKVAGPPAGPPVPGDHPPAPMTPEEKANISNLLGQLNVNKGVSLPVGPPVPMDEHGLPMKAKPTRFVPTGQQAMQPIMISNTMTLDGEAVHRSVFKTAARKAALPSGEYSGFDGRMTPRFPGAPIPI